jgi:wyosine [tRNA(Phe)-imidazoG37] synthetase (radical SAM superfamily)
LPVDSGFYPLPDGFEPTSDELVTVVEDAFVEGKIGVSSMSSDEITFAGIGEPLLRLECIEEVVRTIRDKRHGTRFRVKTNGLIPANDSERVAKALKDCGVKMVSIGLIAENPKLYNDIVKPTNGAGFGEVCSFTIACVEAGMCIVCWK